MWWIYALLSAFFAALTAIFAKAGVKGINADLATAIRTVVILVIAWSIVLARGQFTGLSSVSKSTIGFLVLSGAATGLSWIFYFRALQLGDASKVAPVDKLSVALTVVLAFLFLHEALTWQTLLGAGLIVAGTIVLIL
jgi:transporter family protein